MDELTKASDEKELVRLAQTGDAAAFGSIFDAHYPMIYGMAYRLCGQQQDAEDVAQETFVKAARALHRFRADASLKTWLYRIAVNAANDFLRKNIRHRTEPLLEDISAEKPRSSDTSERVLAALDRLSPAQRQAVVLTFYEGMNHAEAASVLGCAETTVSWRIFTAKKILKKLLAADSATDDGRGK